jgi:hypothetical protein
LSLTDTNGSDDFDIHLFDETETDHEMFDFFIDTFAK